MNRKYTMAFAFILAILGIGLIVFYAANQWGMNIYEVDDLPLADPSACPGDMHFAVIGDYGFAGEPEEDVAALVHS